MTQENSVDRQSPDDEISLKELIIKIQEWWRYLWSKKWIIIAAGIFGGLLGLGYAYTKKPIYTATTTFVLESGEKGGGLGAYAGLASMVGIDLGSGGGGIFQGENILDLYRSNKMIEKTLFSPLDSVQNLPLIERFIERNHLRETWRDNPVLARLDFNADDFTLNKRDRVRDSIIQVVIGMLKNENLNVSKPDKVLSKFQVDVKSTDEVFAKRFNEELVKNVNDFYIQTKTKKVLDNIAILQQKTDSVKRVMNGAINNAAAIADATPNINPTRQAQRTAPIQRAQISAEANKAILSSLVQNLEMSRMTLMKEAPLLQIVDEPIYPLVKQKLSKLQASAIGGVVFGFLVTVFLILREFIKKIIV